MATNNSEQIIENIKAKYPGTTTKINDVGVIEVRVPAEYQSHDVIFIPQNISSNAELLVAYSGMGSNGTAEAAGGLKILRDEMRTSETQPDRIVALAGNWQNGSRVIERALGVTEACGVDPSYMTVQGHSANGVLEFPKVNEFLTNNPNFDKPINIISCDGQWNDYRAKLEGLTALGEHDVSATFVAPASAGTVNKAYANLLENSGVEDIGIIYTDRAYHTDCVKDVNNAQLPEYLMGMNDELYNSNKYYNIDYSDETGIYHFNVYKDGKLTSLTASEYRDYILDGRKSGTVSTNSIKYIKNYKSDGTISSDYNYVYNSMGIISQTLNANTANLNSPFTESKASIPSGLLSSQQSVMEISANAIGKMSQEINYIASAAETIKNMDNELAKMANENLAADINTKLDTYFSNQNPSEFKISNFMFSPGTHSVGTTGKISMSDINKVFSGGKLSGVLLENIESEINNSNALISEISSFQDSIKSSYYLQGEVWNKISNKLDGYIDLMNSRIQSSNELKDAYTKALQLISDFMDGYDYIDDGELPILEANLKQLEAEITNCNHIMTAKITVYTTDANGNTSSHEEFAFSAGERAAAQKLLQECEELKAIIEAYIEKINMLPEILSRAEQIVNDALSNIYSNYGRKTSDMVASGINNYVPPTGTTYKVLTESEFENDIALKNTWGTYDAYLTGIKPQDFSVLDANTSTLQNGTYKVPLTEEEFNANPLFKRKYNSYNEFLETALDSNGRLKEPIVINQGDFADVPYSRNNFKGNGCGASSAIAAISYLTNDYLTPQEASEITKASGGGTNYDLVTNILDSQNIKYYETTMCQNNLRNFLTPGNTIEYNSANKDGTPGTVTIKDPVIIGLQQIGDIPSGHFLCYKGALDENGQIKVDNQNNTLLDVYDSNGGKVSYSAPMKNFKLSAGKIIVMDRADPTVSTLL